MSSTLLSLNGANGTGVLATLTFTIMQQVEQSPITLFNTTLLAPENQYGINPLIDHQVENATVTLRLGNGPVANAGQDQTVDQGTQVVLNGSLTSSSDPNATYTWSFTDGTLKTLQGKVVNYTFNTPGAYNVTLYVQDSYGNSSATITVTVLDTTPPIPKIDMPDFIPGQAITAGERVTFDGAESTDLYSRIIYYSWDLGDESPTVQGNPILHSYSNPGIYNVTLTIIDAAGNNATAIFTVYVGKSTTSASPASLNLPPYLLGILSMVTILALGGSIFWLRRLRMPNEANGASSPKSR
jgi:PKD repeat protein